MDRSWPFAVRKRMELDSNLAPRRQPVIVIEQEIKKSDAEKLRSNFILAGLINSHLRGVNFFGPRTLF